MTTSELLSATADYIAEHGLLSSAWHTSQSNTDIPDDIEPCGCLIGTLRLMAGLPVDHGTISDPGDPYFRAEQALHRATAPERRSSYVGGDDNGTTIYDWSDRHANRELDFSVAKDRYERKLRHIPGREDGPQKVVVLLRRVAEEQKEVEA